MKLKEFATINMGQSPKGETYNTDGNEFSVISVVNHTTDSEREQNIEEWTGVEPQEEVYEEAIEAPAEEASYENEEVYEEAVEEEPAYEYEASEEMIED